MRLTATVPWLIHSDASFGGRPGEVGRVHELNSGWDVDFPSLGVKDTQLILRQISTTWRGKDRGGVTTVLEFVPADSYKKRPVIPEEDNSLGYLNLGSGGEIS